jgi:heme-degrading monooxygenase HmoA
MAVSPFAVRLLSPPRRFKPVEKPVDSGSALRWTERSDKKGGHMITRMIIVKVPADKKAEAERLWKTGCAPLMIQQPGCVSEELLHCREEPGEFISLSKWEDQQAIDRYRASEAHREIQKHTRGLMGVSKIEVKTYDVVG